MATNITNTSVTTDSLTVDTNVLKVDSANNRVGINTTTPDAALQVQNGDITVGWADNFIGAQFQDGTDFRLGMKFGTVNRTTKIVAETNDNNGEITFETNGTERMQVNPTGHVIMPYQPMLTCQPDTSSNVTVPNSNSHIVGWKVVGGRQTFLRSGLTLSGAGGNTIANGNNTGRITFSTGGIYYFDCTIRFENTPGTGNIYVYFNGNTIHRQHVEEWTRYNYAHGRVSRCVSAAAGDYIEFALARSGGIFSGSGDTVNWLTIIKVA